MALRQAILTVFLTCILALAGCDKDKPIDIESTLLTSDIRQVLKDSDPVYASVDVSVAAGERCDEVGPALANLLRSQVYTSATYIACTNTDGDEFAVIRISVPVLWMRSSTSITNKPVAIGINTFPDDDVLHVKYVTNRPALLVLLTELPESLQLDKYEEPTFRFSALLTNDESDSVSMLVSNVFVDDTPVVTTQRTTLKRRESVRIDLSNVANAVLATEGGQVRIISWPLDLSDLPILTPSPTFTANATFTPARETQGGTYVVGNTGGDGVYIRRATDMADRIKAWPDDTEMVEVAGTVEAGGRIWRNVRDPDKNEGFVPDQYLVNVADVQTATAVVAIQTSTAVAADVQASATTQAEFEEKMGTRFVPVPRGKGWIFTTGLLTRKRVEIKVVDVLYGNAAWRLVEQASILNERPPAGHSYILVKLSLRYLSGPEEDDPYRTTDGGHRLYTEKRFWGEPALSIAPRPTFADHDIFPEATIVGWLPGKYLPNEHLKEAVLVYGDVYFELFD